MSTPTPNAPAPAPVKEGNGTITRNGGMTREELERGATELAQSVGCDYVPPHYDPFGDCESCLQIMKDAEAAFNER